MNTKYRVALGSGGVAIATAIGVLFSSQLLLNEAMKMTVKNAAVSGVIAAGFFAAAEYIRRK